MSSTRGVSHRVCLEDYTALSVIHIQKSVSVSSGSIPQLSVACSIVSKIIVISRLSGIQRLDSKHRLLHRECAVLTLLPALEGGKKSQGTMFSSQLATAPHGAAAQRNRFGNAALRLAEPLSHSLNLGLITSPGNGANFVGIGPCREICM